MSRASARRRASGARPTQPDPDRYAQPLRALRRAGRRRRAGRPRRGARRGRTRRARDALRRAGGARAARCSPRADATIDGKPAQAWLAEPSRRSRVATNVTLLPRTTAFGYFPHNMRRRSPSASPIIWPIRSPTLPRERLWQVRAKEVVLAAGAIERPLVFPGNDRPGIMLADAARTYVDRYAARPGTRAVVVTAHDGAYRAALELAACGVEIAAIADVRRIPDGAAARGRARGRAADQHRHDGDGHAGKAARIGGRAVATSTSGRSGGAAETVACDLVLMSAGMTPSVHLFSQSRGKLRWDDALQAYVPGGSAERERSAGACRGHSRPARRAVRRLRAGRGRSRWRRMPQRARRARSPSSAIEPAPGRHVRRGSRSRRRARQPAFVDFQNDVTAKDLALAVREGFRSVEHVKRYTTTGMATDQGKTSNMNALGVLSQVTGALDSGDRANDVRAIPIRRSHSALSRGWRGAICSIRCGARRCTAGPRSRARSSRMSGHGSGRTISRAPARPCTRP